MNWYSFCTLHEYGFHAEGIYEWGIFQTPASPPYLTKFYLEQLQFKYPISWK
jgi:hypothetical protein